MDFTPDFSGDYVLLAAGGGGFDIMSFLPIILIFGVFYFLLIRPQQKKSKEHQGMLGALKRGDRIVTNGGLIGSVTKVMEGHEIQVELGDGIRVLVMRSMISSVMSKGAPVSNSNVTPMAKAKKAASKSTARRSKPKTKA